MTEGNNITQTTENGTNVLPAELLSLPSNYGEKLTPAMQENVRSIVSSIDIKSRDFVTNFGAEHQTTLGKFADTMLSGRGSKEIGETGELLNEAMNQINNYDSDCDNGFFGKLFSNSKKKAKAIIDSYKSVDKKIELIVEQLTTKKREVSKVYDDFESLYASNRETYEYLTTLIYAGEISLEDAKQELEDLQKDVDADPQEVRDFADEVNRFDKRLYDLKMTRAIAISLAPQIRTVQKSAQQVEDTIQTAINTSIPLWKTEMAVALGIKTVQTGLDAANNVTDITNRMFLKVSEAGKDLAVEAAKANQRGVLDIETVRQVNQNAIEALTESTKITREGIEKRKQDTKELKELETSLITAIRNIK